MEEPWRGGVGDVMVEGEADADPHERRDQHEVREVAQVPDVPGEVPDQDQLEEQRQEAEREQLQASPPRTARGPRCCGSAPGSRDPGE
jgi:hypothetical protein